nr:hypothetical protein GCM10020185_11770 [Pseudomonas brassicacearum subsp. brassicacearum]
MLIEPAPGEETGKAVAGRGQQAGKGAHQQLQVERYRAGAGQDADAEQAQADTADLGWGEFFSLKNKPPINTPPSTAWWR